MKELYWFLAFLPLLSTPATAQSDALHKEIMEPINRLFSGMQKGDSAMVHSAFSAEATMVRFTTDAQGNPVLRKEGIEGFLKAVGTPHSSVWNEVIWDEQVQVDGHLAQVWTPFAFYMGNKLNHCGVDAFQLFRDKQGAWKIFYIADTHRNDCQVPAEIRNLFEK